MMKQYNIQCKPRNLTCLDKIYTYIIGKITLGSKICGNNLFGDARIPFMPASVCGCHDPHHTNPKKDDSQEEPYCCPYEPGIHCSISGVLFVGSFFERKRYTMRECLRRMSME